MKYESQNSICGRCEGYRLTSIIIGVLLLLLIVGRCKERKVVRNMENELEEVYLKLEKKEDSLKLLVEDVWKNRVEIDLIVDMYIDSIKYLKNGGNKEHHNLSY